MVWFRRACMAVGLSAALTISTAVASATEVTYSLAGVETAFTDTSGSFTGVALSNDDFALWQAVVTHTGLNDVTPITGGTFQLDGQVRDLQGVITGGEIVRHTSTCRRETFTVAGHVALVGGGFGDFDVTLTHHRRRVPGGQCVTFFATVEGLVTFTLP
jgi:hypothetical protein